MKENRSRESSTSSLFRKLTKTSDLEGFIHKNATIMDLPSFHDHLNQVARQTKQIPEQVIKRAAIERTYGHQLFNGTRKPSRDKVIQLAIGFNLNLEETQTLLQIANKNPLYPKIKRDAAIIYCILNRKDIFEVQSTLQALDLTLLSGD